MLFSGIRKVLGSIIKPCVYIWRIVSISWDNLENKIAIRLFSEDDGEEDNPDANIRTWSRRKFV